ncbi:Glycosyltransferase involved in cell wall bisynthesis [Chitinophaga sp. CF118]|uniref:glycosyltransferase family 4 protein n=1 Tax=Chitinophaga sp. CF118 TaxID=1884367 RepID=UPI0008F2EFCE|nr:glycosyltransferase family 1 protein [Chitinophaga sp. CF118]SFD30483.1 Glycosyltransferase involved in cell wall bisynthesis [Chitinophaga sp. CF118]
MHLIGLDFEKLKYQHNGLYTFCLQLGHRLLQHTREDEKLLYYLPQKFNEFTGDFKKVPYKWYHRYLFNPPQMDVWHAVHQTGNVWPRNKAKKTILTIHDLNFLFDDRKGTAEKNRLLKELQKQVDETDCVVAISKFTLQTIREHIQVPDNKCRIIYQGSEVKEFPGFDAPAYRPAKPFLFSIGMILSKKNFHVLPALLQHNDYELIIAGKPQGDYIKKIEEEADAAGVRARVKLLGTIPDEEKYWYYKNCKAFMFPSIAEGFGAPVVEAMHFGKPVFLSDKTSLPEIGGDAAYYFRNFDKAYMQKTFEDGIKHFEQHNPVAAVQQHAKLFSWDTNAKEYLKLYRTMY